MGFFDDLTKKASETYKNTAEKTNKITREMKLKSLINEDKTRIERLYIEIGRKVYEKHVREENIDIKNELKEECSKIDAYAKEIEDMRMEILELKDLRLCRKCAAEVPLAAKFCPKCGASQEEMDAKDSIPEVEKVDPDAQATEPIVEVVDANETVNAATEVTPADIETQVVEENVETEKQTNDSTENN